MHKRTKQGFTLVELLVVIGIIAVLISILLPSLNRPRRSANSVACLSNLKQMGMAVIMYTNANKGVLPYSYYDNGGVDPTNLGSDWSVQLLNVLNGKGPLYRDQLQDSKTRKLFIDSDTIAVPESVGMTLHYSAHPRLMPPIPVYEPAVGGAMRRPAKITQVKRTAEIVLIFDGTQVADQEYRALSTAWCIDSHHYDGWSISNPSFLLENSANANNGDSIDPGENLAAAPATWGNSSAGTIRWRHMANNSANFLFVDGHAESRLLKRATKAGVKGQCDLLKKNVNTVLVHQ